jgi:ABC-type amino acid transport substrate-binding protein
MLLALPIFAKPVLKVGMPMPGQVPFLWINDSGAVTGIYADTLKLVAEDLQHDIEFVALSQARLNRLFAAGEIDIEIGVSEKKMQLAGLAENSVFSRPFGIANEVIVYNKNLAFPAFILKDLKGKKVAAVRGASIPDYIQRDDYASILQIAKRVNRGWSQVGLMREAPALHYKSNEGMEYKISLPYESNPISFRLHKKHQALLKTINQSIEKFEEEGNLDDVVCKYLCGS